MPPLWPGGSDFPRVRAAVSNGLKLTGYPAWLAWLGFHLYYLIGFRNRILVLLNWAWYNWFHERQVRLITDCESPPGPPAGTD